MTAILVLGAVAFIVALPAGVEAGFLGWLELAPAQRLALHLPLALAVAASGLAAICLVRWARRRGSDAMPRRDAALAVASLALVAQLMAWGLIGWGFS